MTDYGPLFGAPKESSNRIYGAVVGVVTNNKDPKGLGRVKVKFPWLSDADESSWARMAVPMAGKAMGIFFLPEVDDEVLVVFEHGRIDSPVVMGAVWNGKEGPPADNADGKNNLRIIKSRSGHTITLDDTDGAETITIADGKQKSSVVFDAANGALLIQSEGDVTVQAKGTLTLQGDKAVAIKSTGSGKVTVEGGNGVAIKGLAVDLNDGKLKVQ